MHLLEANRARELPGGVVHCVCGAHMTTHTPIERGESCRYYVCRRYKRETRSSGGGEMDPGEQSTATRDEHYNLISVLYHALKGAYNCNTYALDAEAAGDVPLTAFFREAGTRQARLAERTKGILGIVEEEEEEEEAAPGGGSAAPSSAAPGEDLGEAAGVPRAGDEEAVPATDLARTSSGAARPRGEGAETPEGAPPDAPRVAIDRITPEDLDPTISALQGGIARLAIGRAAAEVETWERKLEATGDPELEAIAGNLGALRGLLTADDIDIAAAGPLLMTLGEQVKEVASGGVEERIADKLRRLGDLLTNEGRSLSG